uniref:Gag-pol polyprotein n=1 Tax=Solanum tuberosum TaxID=4113 RepID=M1DR08_SOLTU
MPLRRAYVKRNKDKEKLAPLTPIGPLDGHVTHVEFWATFQVLAQAMIAQNNREVLAPINPNVNMITVRVQNFTRMNPLEFHGSKVDDDPQKFIEGIQKITEIMAVTSIENRVAQIWFK